MSAHDQSTATGVPPLRIHHLLAWMTVTAVLISATLGFDRTMRNGPPVENPLTIASLLIGAVGLAGVLTLVAFGVYWRWHGYGFPGSPGDWALTVIAIALGQFLTMFALFLLIFLAVGDDDWFPAYYFVATLALIVGWARLNAAGMSRYADTRAWRIFYWVMILVPGIVLWAFILDVWGTITNEVLISVPLAAVIACVLFAAWRDVRSRTQRPWTHWVGVGAVVWLCAAMIGLSLS